MPYCLYLRKSRADLEAEARGEGETLARHEKILLELARKMKLNITQIHREIVSGETISSRPIMQQLLYEVEQGMWKGVLVVEVERLARGDTIDQGIVAQAFKYSNTKIITPMKVYDPSNEFDEEYFEFGLFMSRREYKTINRRLQRGRLESVKEGKYVGNIPPFGYKRVKLEKEKGFTLEPDPEQAPIVKLIFEWYTSGIGVARIVRKLNEMKIPTAKGGDWVNSTVQGMLRNPVYNGKVRWMSRPLVKKIINGEIKTERPRVDVDDYHVYDGLHEAIIDDETYNKAQELLKLNSTPKVPSIKKMRNPLAGLIICGKCGRTMARRPYSSGQPDSLICPVTSCDNISSYLSIVEKKLLQALESWLENYKVEFKKNIQEPSYSVSPKLLQDAIKRLDNEIHTLYKQLDSLHDLLEQGIYTTDKFLERNRVLTEKIKTLETEKKYIDKQLKQITLQKESEKKIIPKVEKVIDIYNKTKDPKAKNMILKEVLDKVVYLKTKKGNKYDQSTLEDFELVLYPNLPKNVL